MASSPRPKTGLRLARVVRTKEAFLREIDRLAEGMNLRGATPHLGPGGERLRVRLQRSAAGIESRCRKAGGEPQDLPPRSRRAHALMAFLGADGRLEAYLGTLAELNRLDVRVRARLDHIGGLYRIERQGDRVTLTASVGFVGAPAQVLQALIRLGVPYARRRGPRSEVHAYADGPDFARALQAVEAAGGTGDRRAAGRHVNLQELFETVNQSYFGGDLVRPRLAWSERPTRVEFGAYEPASDTVRLSITLDSEAVPRHVLEHVMHHELLHRELGAESRGGRRRFHSARFRRAERRFPRYDEADAYLKDLAARLARRKP